MQQSSAKEVLAIYNSVRNVIPRELWTKKVKFAHITEWHMHNPDSVQGNEM